ncbi:MAG TPA: sulfatase-like hydrolase/transferase, partial [Acidimicrobiales bacterium]|nr:sulfatase-like hydrolase/transferase [Acidimicrobiales bacterium]
MVVVLADDMGWGDLGCYGATKIPTPAMDRVAAEGVRATDC